MLYYLPLTNTLGAVFQAAEPADTALVVAELNQVFD